MLPVLMFPQFDPVLVHLGPLAVRWYALAYIAGIVIGIQLLKRLVTWAPRVASPELADDFLVWVTLGIVLGGRLGYVLFYQPMAFLAHPAQIDHSAGQRQPECRECPKAHPIRCGQASGCRVSSLRVPVLPQGQSR